MAALRAPQARAIGTATDSQVIAWYLGWTPFALSHGQNPLFTTYIDYPTGINLLWNTWVPLPALLLWPVTRALGLIASYNLAAVLAVALSAWCAYFACRRYARSHIAAAIGGLLYGFSPFMLAHALGHLHLVIAVVPPLMLLLLDDLLVRRSHPPVLVGAAIGGLALLQLLISEELLVSEAFAGCVGIALLMALTGKPSAWVTRNAVRGLATAAVCLVVPAAPLLIYQLAGPQHVHSVLQPSNLYVSDLLNFILPTQLEAVGPAGGLDVVNRFTGNVGEWGAYLGIPLIAVLVVAAVGGWHQLRVRFFSLMAVSFALLSLGPFVHVAGRLVLIPVGLAGVLLAVLLPAPARRPVTLIFIASWVILALVPGFNNLLPARLTLWVFLFGSLLLALWCDRLFAQANMPRRLGGFAVLALALIPLFPRLPFPTTAAVIPSFFTSGSIQSIPSGSVALVAPYAHGGSADAMLWQAASGFRFRMPEGYAWRPGSTSSPEPSRIGFALSEIATGDHLELNETDRQAMLAELAGWRVATVLVGPMLHQTETTRFFEWLLETPAVDDGGVLVWRIES